MRRWNLPQVNTKVMCAVLTAAMVTTGFTACGGTTSTGTESAASESAEQKETIAPEGTTEQSTVEQSTETESGEEKVESYLGQITAIDGNVISIALAEKPETPDGEASIGEAPAARHLEAISLTDRHQTATEALLMEMHPLVRYPVGKSLMLRHRTAKNLLEKLRTVRNPRKIC